MSHTQHGTTNTAEELNAFIHNAIKKINGRKENDICRYLPASIGGYIHHFTMRKMKHENPDILMGMIKQFILEPTKPQTVPPKSRAARGSRKRKDQIMFSKEEIERMLQIARLAGDKDMIRKLTPRKDLRQIKRELIASIRQEHVDHELWNSYVESMSAQAIPSINV